jgi:prepilin-type N-terminal cleavage/methylation domain-containing protein
MSKKFAPKFVQLLRKNECRKILRLLGLRPQDDVTTQNNVTNLFTYSPSHLFTSKKAAFTLAEVLITLGIIGVVAALTLPSVIQSHQKQVTVNKLKKVYSVLSQVVTRAYAENDSSLGNLAGTAVSADKTKEFFNTYWLPYFKSPNIAKDGKSLYSDLAPYYSLNGNRSNTKAYYTSYGGARILYSTADGFIMYVEIMDWSRDENGNQIAIYYPTADVIVDINGLKGPNTWGRDVFKFKVNFEKNKVIPTGMDYTTETINSNCSKNSSGGSYCAAKIVKDGWKIADDYPW